MKYEITITVLVDVDDEEDVGFAADQITGQIYNLDEMTDYICTWAPTDKESYA